MFWTDPENEYRSPRHEKMVPDPRVATPRGVSVPMPSCTVWTDSPPPGAGSPNIDCQARSTAMLSVTPVPAATSMALMPPRLGGMSQKFSDGQEVGSPLSE